MTDKKKKTDYIQLTPEIIEALKGHMARTGCGPTRILRGRKDKPKGICPACFYRWIGGKNATAQKAHVEYFLKLYDEYEPLIEITVALVGRIKSELDRTGLKITHLLRNRSNLPDGLNYGVLTTWMMQSTKRARRDHVDYVLGFLESSPDRNDLGVKKEKIRPGREEYIDFTSETRKELTLHRNRTGIGPSALLEMAVSPPEGLNVYDIYRLFSGNVKTVDPRKLHYVLDLWASLPDKDQ